MFWQHLHQPCVAGKVKTLLARQPSVLDQMWCSLLTQPLYLRLVGPVHTLLLLFSCSVPRQALANNAQFMASIADSSPSVIRLA